MSDKIIDVPASGGEEPERKPDAIVRQEQGGAMDRPLTLDEVSKQLEFIRSVMRQEMKEGQDFGKVPGCGDKPGLFQPGAQKLCLTFRLTPKVTKEILRDLGNYHREYEFTLTLISATGREWDGVGTCSTLESKYRYRQGERSCPNCGKRTIIKGKAEFGGGWLCFAKKGGCGAKWPDGAKEIEGQNVGKVEHENPPDFWNTVRKMAFKRALVHASINATNTSELWSQDLEDLPAGATTSDDPEPEKPAQKGTAAPAKPNGGGNGQQKLKAWLELCRAKALRSVNNDALLEYARDKGWIGTEQGEESITAKNLFPSVDTSLGIAENSPKVRQDLDNLVAALVNLAPTPAEIEPPPPPKLSDDKPKQGELAWETFQGVVDCVVLKSGKSSRGPWTRYGVKSGEIWFNTFSDTIGKLAQSMQGKEAIFGFITEKDDKGGINRRLEGIELVI